MTTIEAATLLPEGAPGGVAKVKDYKNFWPATQGVSGIYCAILGTFSYFFPPSQSPNPSSGAQWPKWTDIFRANVPAPVAIGLALLGLSFSIPALISWFRKLQTKYSVRLHVPEAQALHVKPSPIVAATKRTFDALSVSQRFLVKEIYEHPGTALPFLAPLLTDMGFPPRVASESIQKVFITNLVCNDSRRTDPNPSVKDIVSKILEETHLPSAEIVRQINVETSSATKLDAILGCERVLELMRQGHLQRLVSARSDMAAAGSCNLLANQAGDLKQELEGYVREDLHDLERKGWNFPLDPKVISTALGQPWSWQHRAWAVWQSSFWYHQAAVIKFCRSDLKRHSQSLRRRIWRL